MTRTARYRLSDINVTEVDEATVFEKSRCEEHGCSAFVLISAVCVDGASQGVAQGQQQQRVLLVLSQVIIVFLSQQAPFSFSSPPSFYHAPPSPPPPHFYVATLFTLTDIFQRRHVSRKHHRCIAAQRLLQTITSAHSVLRTVPCAACIPRHVPIEFTPPQVQLPSDLAALVAEANGRFQAEIAAWDASHAGSCVLPAAPATASQEVRDDP